MTKLDKILDAASITHIEIEYPGLHFHGVNTTLVKEQIKALFLELIGEDKPLLSNDNLTIRSDDSPLYAQHIQRLVDFNKKENLYIQEYNMILATLRKKVDKL